MRVKSLFRGLGVAALATMLTAPAAHSAEDAFIVIASSGSSTSLLAGDLVAGGADVRVEDGVVITVLDPSGRLFRMVGPCLCRLPETAPLARADDAITSPQTRGFKLGSDNSNLWNVALPKLRELTEPPAAEAPVETAPATRGGDVAAPVAPPDLWSLATDSSGSRCVRRGDVFLWRRKADVAVRVDLRSSGARETGLTWPAGQDQMRLPSQFVVDGEQLMLMVNDKPRRLIVHVLPETIAENEWGEILIWMAARDCRRQAQFLVDGLNDGSLFPDQGRKPGLSEL